MKRSIIISLATFIFIAVSAGGAFATGSISGKVLVAETLEPLSGASVKVVERFLPCAQRGIMTTGPDGAFQFTNLQQGSYYICAEKAGYGRTIKFDIMAVDGSDTGNQNIYVTNNPGSIIGTVKNATGAGINGVTINAGLAQGGWGSWSKNCTTYLQGGQDGYYRFDDLCAGDYAVSLNGFTKDSVDYCLQRAVNVAVNVGQATTVDFIASPSATITGTVTAGGNPLQGVSLELRLPSGWWMGGATTGADGKYTIKYIQAGNSYYLTAAPPSGSSYQTAYLGISTPSAISYTQNVAMVAGAIQVSGKVTDKTTSVGIPGLYVFLSGDNNFYESTWTDSNGNYAINNLPSGTFRIGVRPDSLYAGAEVTQNVTANTTINFALAPESVYSGIIKDYDTKQPIQLPIEIRCGRINGYSIKYVHSDPATGMFTANGLIEGPIEIEVEPDIATGYAWNTSYIYLAEGEHKNGVEILLKKGALISGSVFRSDGVTKVPEAWLSLGGPDPEHWTGRANSNGDFSLRLAGGIDGKYCLATQTGNNSMGVVGIPQKFTVSGPGDNKTVNIPTYLASGECLNITGNVLNPNGYAKTSLFGIYAAEAGEVINRENYQLFRPVQIGYCASGGSYSLAVPPGWTYDLYMAVASQNAHGANLYTMRDYLTGVAPGSSGQDMNYSSVGGTVTGKVTYESQGVLMARIYIQDAAGNLRGWGTGYTDENGAYAFYNVPAGSCVVKAYHSDYGWSQEILVSGVADNVVKSNVDIEFAQTNPILSDNIDGTGKNDFIIDFGPEYGLWIYRNNGTWFKLHDLSPALMAYGNGNIDGDVNHMDDLTIDFGPGYGIWIYFNNSTWQQLHSISCESITIADLDHNGQREAIIDFGPSYGIWVYYNNSTWQQLHTLSPKFITPCDINDNDLKDLIIDFGPKYGIWVYQDNSTWWQLHSVSADSIVTAELDDNYGEELIIDFGPSYGIWIRNSHDLSWRQLHAVSPDSITAARISGTQKKDLVIDFGQYGIWIYRNNSTWTQLHTVNPEYIQYGDYNASGKQELIIDFGPQYGIWVYQDNSSWWQLHTVSP